MRIADIRRVIDTANWCRNDFHGHTQEEFLRANVDEQLGAHIARLQALDIPARFTRDIETRDNAIEYAQRMIARWTGLRDAAAKLNQPPAVSPSSSPSPAPSPASVAVERKPQFAIGTKFRTRDRFPKLCTVTDILTTRNSAGEVVGIAYEATHQFCGQTVTDRNVCQVTIARGLFQPPPIGQEVPASPAGVIPMHSGALA